MPDSSRPMRRTPHSCQARFKASTSDDTEFSLPANPGHRTDFGNICTMGRFPRAAWFILAIALVIRVAWDPFLIYFSGLLLSETLCTATLAWATWLLVCRRCWAAAVVLLLAVFVRPSAILLAPLLAAVAAAANPATGSAYPLVLARRR